MKEVFYVVQQVEYGYSKLADGNGFRSHPRHTVDDVPHFSTAIEAAAEIIKRRGTQTYVIVRVERTTIPATFVRKIKSRTHIEATKTCVLFNASNSLYPATRKPYDGGTPDIQQTPLFSDLGDALNFLSDLPARPAAELKVFNVVEEEIPETVSDVITVLE